MTFANVPILKLNHLYALQPLYSILYFRDDAHRQQEAKVFANYVATQMALSDDIEEIRILEVLSGSDLHRQYVLDALKEEMPQLMVTYVTGDHVDAEPSDVVAGTGPIFAGDEYDFIVGFYMSFNSFLDPNTFLPSSVSTRKAIYNLNKMLRPSDYATIYLDFSGSGAVSGLDEAICHREYRGLTQPCEFKSFTTECDEDNLPLFVRLLESLTGISDSLLASSVPIDLIARNCYLECDVRATFDRRTGVVSEDYPLIKLKLKGDRHLCSFRTQVPFGILYTSETHAALLAHQAGFQWEDIYFGQPHNGVCLLLDSEVNHQEGVEAIRNSLEDEERNPAKEDGYTLYYDLAPSLLILQKPSA